MEIPILYCLVSGSALTDVYKQKIFNQWLALFGMLGIICAATNYYEPMWYKLFRSAVVLVILQPLYKMKGLGAGDVKLFMVVALFLGKEELWCAMILSFIIAAVLGIVKVIIKRDLHQTIHFAIPILISVILVTNSYNLQCL